MIIIKKYLTFSIPNLNIFYIVLDEMFQLYASRSMIYNNRDFIRQLIIFDSMNEEKYLIIDQMEVDANQPFILVYHAPED